MTFTQAQFYSDIMSCFVIILYHSSRCVINIFSSLFSDHDSGYETDECEYSYSREELNDDDSSDSDSDSESDCDSESNSGKFVASNPIIDLGS